ncbi:hypothetical protein GLX_03750 [Komagataeibacter medellinensis NBRC 3288]|uniref:Uncharacterized protein n=2 Tax=Komagataeibacter medellinensis TaxID=1177712 RepID=G2I3U0_KOMMN|nr:hypothetical protein GLX_03750 [Komagataeibacter medellinensis NBRC 3288]
MAVQYWGKTMFRMQVKETPDISVPFDPPASGTPVQLPPPYDPDRHDPDDEKPLDPPDWPVPDDDEDGDHDDGRDEPPARDEENGGPLFSLCVDPHARSL